MIEPKELHKKINEYFNTNNFKLIEGNDFNYPTKKKLLDFVGLTAEEFNELNYNPDYDLPTKYASEKMKYVLEYLLSNLFNQGNIKHVLDELSLNHGIFIKL